MRKKYYGSQLFGYQLSSKYLLLCSTEDIYTELELTAVMDLFGFEFNKYKLCKTHNEKYTVPFTLKVQIKYN